MLTVLCHAPYLRTCIILVTKNIVEIEYPVSYELNKKKKMKFCNYINTPTHPTVTYRVLVPCVGSKPTSTIVQTQIWHKYLQIMQNSCPVGIEPATFRGSTGFSSTTPP